MCRLDNLDARVKQAANPERVRDILVLIFRELMMRHTRHRTEHTGFEAATNDELQLAFYRTANELIVRWGRLRDLYFG